MLFNFFGSPAVIEFSSRRGLLPVVKFKIGAHWANVFSRKRGSGGCGSGIMYTLLTFISSSSLNKYC
jgi:hypothetical protein